LEQKKSEWRAKSETRVSVVGGGGERTGVGVVGERRGVGQRKATLGGQRATAWGGFERGGLSQSLMWGGNPGSCWVVCEERLS